MSPDMSVFALVTQNWQNLTGKVVKTKLVCTQKRGRFGENNGLGLALTFTRWDEPQYNNLDSLHGYGKLGLIRGEYHCIETGLLLKCQNILAFYKPQFTWYAKNLHGPKLSRNVCKLLDLVWMHVFDCKLFSKVAGNIGLKKNLMTKSCLCSHTKFTRMKLFAVCRIKVHLSL